MSNKNVHTNAQAYNLVQGDELTSKFYMDLHSGEIRSDESIRDFGYTAGQPLEDRHIMRMTIHYSAKYGLELTEGKAWSLLRVLASERGRNPVTDTLSALAWDGKARLDTLLIDYAGAEDTPYTRAVTSKAMIGAVARAFEHGCKVDNVLILEGPQGAKKSSLILELASIAGVRYVLTSKIAINHKDTFQNMAGAWVVNIDEFASFRKAEMDDLKAFVSQQMDKYRLPYDRIPRMVKRACVFMATINDTESKYLDDPTGLRRWWPVAVKNIDLDGVKGCRGQLWAEAVVRYQQGEKWYVDESSPLAELVRQEQTQRQVIDPWETSILSFVANTSSKEFSVDQLFDALKIDVKNRAHADRIRVGKVLTKLNLGKRRVDTKVGRFVYYQAATLDPTVREAFKVSAKSAPIEPVSPEEESLN